MLIILPIAHDPTKSNVVKRWDSLEARAVIQGARLLFLQRWEGTAEPRCPFQQWFPFYSRQITFQLCSEICKSVQSGSERLRLGCTAAQKPQKTATPVTFLCMHTTAGQHQHTTTCDMHSRHETMTKVWLSFCQTSVVFMNSGTEHTHPFITICGDAHAHKRAHTQRLEKCWYRIQKTLPASVEVAVKCRNPATFKSKVHFNVWLCKLMSSLRR